LKFKRRKQRRVSVTQKEEVKEEEKGAPSFKDILEIKK
jgi:hypothetical protein